MYMYICIYIYICIHRGKYNILEYNASDARGQKAIQEMADGIADNTTICFGAQKRSTEGLTKKAIVVAVLGCV